MDAIHISDEGADKDSDWSLTGFLFGNINEKGELEDGSILDEVAAYLNDNLTVSLTLIRLCFVNYFGQCMVMFLYNFVLYLTYVCVYVEKCFPERNPAVICLVWKVLVVWEAWLRISPA